jgi:hypothetical protein
MTQERKLSDDLDLSKEVMRHTVDLVRRARSLGDVDQISALIEVAEAALNVRSVSRSPDPWVTATFAEITGNPSRAVELYELALRQLERFPDEPRFEWRMNLAVRLTSLGREMEAKPHLISARAEAAYRGNKKAVERADELLLQHASL